MGAPRGTYTMQETAKFLGIGSKALFQRLRKQQILNRHNLPYQTFIDRCYFTVETRKFEQWNGQYQTYGRTRVTTKGLDWLRQQLNIDNKKPSSSELKTRLNNTRNEILQIACHCIEENQNELAHTLRQSASGISTVLKELGS